jgi:hypothetical protein
MTKEAKPFPTLLTKSDAMLFVADRLEHMLADLEILSLIGGLLTSKPDMEPKDVKGKEAFHNVRTSMRGIIDVDLQKSALQEAAREIRELANETKLADARAATRGISAV